MKFGNYTPKAVGAGSGMGPNVETERHLYEFANGYQASVLVTTPAAVAGFPEFYPDGEESVGKWELCVTVNGIPVPMLRNIFGIDIEDPLGRTFTGVHVNLSEAEVTAMLSRLESAEALEAA